MMPPQTFAAYAQATGLDVLALQKLFRCSYLSVTRRLGEVMRRQPLAAVIYERQGENPAAWTEQADPGQFRASAVIRTPGFGERSSRLLYGFRGRMPLPDRPPSVGSAAERVILTGRAEYAEVEPWRDGSGRGGLAVSAKPVIWHGRLAKVVVVAVPYGRPGRDTAPGVSGQAQAGDGGNLTGRAGCPMTDSKTFYYIRKQKERRCPHAGFLGPSPSPCPPKWPSRWKL